MLHNGLITVIVRSN